MGPHDACCKIGRCGYTSNESKTLFSPVWHLLLLRYQWSKSHGGDAIACQQSLARPQKTVGGNNVEEVARYRHGSASCPQQMPQKRLHSGNFSCRKQSFHKTLQSQGRVLELPRQCPRLVLKMQICPVMDRWDNCTSCSICVCVCRETPHEPRKIRQAERSVHKTLVCTQPT